MLRADLFLVEPFFEGFLQFVNPCQAILAFCPIEATKQVLPTFACAVIADRFVAGTTDRCCGNCRVIYAALTRREVVKTECARRAAIFAIAKCAGNWLKASNTAIGRTDYCWINNRRSVFWHSIAPSRSSSHGQESNPQPRGYAGPDY
jgi:hypothetical protein